MNLKQTIAYALFLSVFSVLTGCFEAPNFPDNPSISFENVEFKEGSTAFDSLIVSIRYEDGDGDLGIDNSFTDDKFSEGFFYTFNNGDLVSIKDIGEPINIEDFAGSVVPPYEHPFTCSNWVESPTLNGAVVNDTLFYVPNPDHFNIFVKFLYRDINANPDEPFKVFDWIAGDEDSPEEECGVPVDGRFPLLKDPSDSNAPIEGTLRYAIVSIGLVSFFKDRELKLEVFIKDRKLQDSNTVTITGNKDNDNGVSFTLAGIQVN